MPNLSGSVIKYSSGVLDVANLSCVMHLKMDNHLILVQVLRSNMSIPESVGIKTSQ